MLLIIWSIMQGYQPPVSSVQIESVHEMHATTNPLKVASAGADDGSKAVERPRLSLKPRSLPAEQSDESAERARLEILLYSCLLKLFSVLSSFHNQAWCLLRLLRFLCY